MNFKAILLLALTVMLGAPAALSQDEAVTDLKKVIAIQQDQLANQKIAIEQLKQSLKELTQRHQALETRVGGLDASSGHVKLGSKIVITKTSNSYKWEGEKAGLKGDKGDRGPGGNNLHRVNSGGGGRSCQTACKDNGNKSCVLAWAGSHPYETWSCTAAPQGNLSCLCYK